MIQSHIAVQSASEVSQLAVHPCEPVLAAQPSVVGLSLQGSLQLGTDPLSVPAELRHACRPQ